MLFYTKFHMISKAVTRNSTYFGFYREKAAGASLREGIVEVAFEQWTEQVEAQVSSNVIPTLQGSSIGQWFPY